MKVTVPLETPVEGVQHENIEAAKEAIVQVVRNNAEAQISYSYGTEPAGHNVMHGEVGIIHGLELAYIKELLAKLKANHPATQEQVDEILYRL